jgi:hypothetical protein
MRQVKIRGREVVVDGAAVAEIRGYRDPSGRNHHGYHIGVPGHGTIGLLAARRSDEMNARHWVPSHYGCFAYATDAQKEARWMFRDDAWKEHLDHVVKAHAEADRQTAEAPNHGEESDSALCDAPTP